MVVVDPHPPMSPSSSSVAKKAMTIILFLTTLVTLPQTTTAFSKIQTKIHHHHHHQQQQQHHLQPHRQKHSCTSLSSSFLSELGLPSFEKKDDNSKFLNFDDEDYTSPDSLFKRARRFVASDFGISDSSMISDDDDDAETPFVWVGPSVGTTGVLNREEYLAAGKFFDLRSTFPDLEYRAHDFRLVEGEPTTVRLTTRTVGTMRGPLRLRSETLPPNGRRMICPPEGITITFSPKTGKITKLCSGFPLDRLIGNTNGLCGVMAAAVIAGDPPSQWETVPPFFVIQRFFGRTVKQLPSDDDNNNFLAPFPESVMIQLTKGVIATNNGVDDPDVLSDDFTFCAPIVGPLKKNDFLKAFGGFNLARTFPDIASMSKLTNFRVDPYDPYRVWLDSSLAGTWTGPLPNDDGGKVTPSGKKVQCPPEATSYTFDDDGFCVRMTTGYSFDPTIGNSGGLGAAFGLLYGIGKPFPGLLSRPLPELLARLKKQALQPITGVDVDDLSLRPTRKIAPSSPTSQAVTTKELQPRTTLDAGKARAAQIAQQKDQAAAIRQQRARDVAEKAAAAREDKAAAREEKAAAAQAAREEKAAAAEAAREEKAAAAQAAAEAAREQKAAAAEAARQQRAEKAAAAEAAAQAAREQKAAAAQAARQQKASAAQAAAEAARGQRATAAKAARQQRAEKAAAAQAAAEAARQQKAAAAEAARQQKAEAAAREEKARAAAEKAAAAEADRQEKARAAAEKAAAAEAARQQKAQAAAEKAVRQRKAQAAAQKAAAAAEAARKAQEMKKINQQRQVAKRGTRQVADDDRKRETKPSFFAFEKKSTTPKPSPATDKKKPIVPPRGVPKLDKWRKNRDGSITGIISGSPVFDDGEQITTSPIQSGNIRSGSVVQTESGSKYFLS